MPTAALVKTRTLGRVAPATQRSEPTDRALRLRASHAALLVAQLGVLWTIGAAANAAVTALHAPVPGNAVAMLATFVLLATGVLRLGAVERAATLLVKHLTVFFVPYAVGIVALWSAIAPHALRSFAVLIASAACGIVATGLTAQYVRRWRA